MALLPIITQGHNALQNFDSENSTQRDHRKIAFVTVSIVSLGMILHVVTKVLVRNSRESKSDLTWKFDVSIMGNSDALWLDLSKQLFEMTMNWICCSHEITWPNSNLFSPNPGARNTNAFIHSNDSVKPQNQHESWFGIEFDSSCILETNVLDIVVRRMSWGCITTNWIGVGLAAVMIDACCSN